jgi:hypothetical protein
MSLANKQSLCVFICLSTHYSTIQYILTLCVKQTMRQTLLLLFYILSNTVQSQVGIGSWQSHNPMSSFSWIGETQDKIFAANKFGILSYDRTDNSTEVLTKVNSLSGTDISIFECSPNGKVCVVGYSNGNLDFIDNNNVITNQPAIMNSQTVGDKSVNCVFFDGANAWLGSGIGLLQIDLTTFNVLEYTPVNYNGENQPVQNIYKFGTTIYISSKEYLLSSSSSSIFTNPVYFDITPDLELDKLSQFFEIDNEVHFTYQTNAFTQDTLYYLSNGEWIPSEFLAGQGIRHIQNINDSLLVTNATSINLYDASLTLLQTIFTYGPKGMDPATSLKSKFSEKIIVADFTHGGVEVSFTNQYSGTIFNRSSPFPVGTNISSLKAIDNSIYALPGGNEYTYLRPNIHKYENSQWSSKELVNEELTTFVNGNEIVSIADQFFISSDRGGIAVTDKDLNILNIIDDANSPLVDFQEGYRYFGISGLDKDNDNNLYLSHTKSNTPLKILLESGEWIEISFNDENLKEPKCADLLVHSSGMIFQIIIDVGVLVYDPKGTPSDVADDEYLLLTSSPTAGNLPSSQVSCITEDLDGEIWIGTNEGIGIIYTPENIFDQSFEGAQQVVVNQDGYNGYLFGTETIEAIAIDGANRKWVGTFNSGLFLISEDGLNQIHSFTSENSPLFDNKVQDIAIHPKTGEVFVATESGLVSYRSDATSSKNTLDNIKVFPNPVKPNYSGPIAISNLSSGSQVRITDVNGSLIFETESLGGQATWGGTNLNGQKVQPGVYLVHVATSAADQGVTRKILFLKQ